MIHWKVAVLIILAVIPVAGYLYERFGDWNDGRRNPAPGRIVPVGDHRLHVLCKGSGKGSGAPTVVIEQGAGEPSRLWWPLQDQVAEFAAVCTYDRAGYGWSQPAGRGRTIEQRAEELHALLANGSVQGPYILVAHSYGGLIARAFAQKYPGVTGGLVLVDTPEEGCIFRQDVLDFYSRIGAMMKVVGFLARFGLPRLLSHWISLDKVGFPFIRQVEYAAAADDLASLQLQPRPKLGNLGRLPLAVITHGRPFPGPFAILEQGWTEGQERLAALSTRSELIVAKNSNHMIEIDEPAIIVDAIRRLALTVCNTP
jgi:pimeloyl-ACP methyl ester carboxylesterase